MLRTEHKAFAFKLSNPPDAQGNFSGYAAVFGNVDKGNDLIEPGAVTKTVQENPEVPIFWAHNYGTVPIGTGTLSRDAKGVKIDGQLFIDTSDTAREVFGAMKAGAVKGLSIGYNTLKRTFQSGIRHLQEIAIGEVSLAPSGFQMNDFALVESVKSQKWLGQYGTTESVDCLLSAIGTLTDYLASEVAEGDTEDATAVSDVISTLVELLNGEVEEVAEGTASNPLADGSDFTDASDVVETMRAPIGLLQTKLADLLERGQTTRRGNGATEPDLSELRSLIADMRSAA